ncbi:hypothetical protein A2165_03915 [Candidatus Curtissbacteria bacterium RBG_13_40_7]|uniref:Uncharacterized protein n=1 Tax=Candidatus Curtissbacteria bacterium RBG_13_40_7 TaxID=1797706 RepID=A0A1F5FTP0_9BACT|nr:MAG: hypothetical protein A2165_03915 [Candidatus Curtissbacteria bacterium RBG_13_40_7]
MPEQGPKLLSPQEREELDNELAWARAQQYREMREFYGFDPLPPGELTRQVAALKVVRVSDMTSQQRYIYGLSIASRMG